jgi:hypothetical protein
MRINRQCGPSCFALLAAWWAGWLHGGVAFADHPLEDGPSEKHQQKPADARTYDHLVFYGSD